MSCSPALPTPSGAVPLILHVTEAMGGGLEDAVHDFIRSSPQYRHALLFTRRGSFSTQDGHPAGLVEVIDAGRGVRALARAYGPVVDRLAPDVIHLHSAWAGLVGRARPAAGRAPVVYSPHSYFFDRRDLMPWTRAAARLLERVLSSRTVLTAAVSPFEAQTARALGSDAAYIPNIARLPEDLRWSPEDRGPARSAEVLLVGRITAQKDPKFLLRTLEQVRRRAPEARFTWVGSGDRRTETKLRAAGVHVTGWVPRAECLALMARADVYLHTAGWEGSPITLLEAASIGVPIVARSIPALDSLGFDPHLQSPHEVAAALVGLFDGEPAPIGPPSAEPRDQANAIEITYSAALRAAPDRVPVPVPVPLAAPVPLQAPSVVRLLTVEEVGQPIRTTDTTI